MMDNWKDILYLTPFQKRYKPPKRRSRLYWGNLIRRYANTEKDISSYDLHWYVISFDDGHKELAYLRVLQGGLFSGLYPAIYRGAIIPRRIDFGTFAHIKDIRLAF